MTMAYMIEITHEQKSEMAENAEKVLRYAGKLMQNIEDFCGAEDGEMGERTYNYGRMGERDDMGGYDRSGYRGDVGGYNERVGYRRGGRMRSTRSGYREGGYPYFE